MTKEEGAALSVDPVFRGRIKMCCLQFALSIQNESPAIEGHSARYRWAQSAFDQPDIIAGRVQQPTVMDPNVQAQGAAIPDDQLQSAVEATVAKFF